MAISVEVKEEIMTNRAMCSVSLILLVAYFSSDFAMADSPVVVPIRLLQNFPVLSADIGGIAVPLQFDSGNSGTVALTQTILDQVKAVTTGEFSQGIDGKGNVMKFPKYKIPRIRIGAAVFTDVIGELDVHDPSYPAAQVGQQGFLGTALLKNYQVMLDYRHRRIVLIPSGSIEPRRCHGTAVPFLPEGRGEPGTKADIDAVSLVVGWDTGAPISMLSKRFAEMHGLQHTAGTMVSKRLTLAGTDFGPLRFRIEELSLPPEVGGFIGYNFFARHVVCLDFTKNQVLIQR
jgi:hypothetical protein